jgi:hypothetical protein
MENSKSLKNKVKIMGIVSLSISFVVILLLLNWFLKLTPFQKLEGSPLLLTPFVCLAGLIFGLTAHKESPGKFTKSGIISNSILIVISFIYWIAGTIFFGP